MPGSRVVNADQTFSWQIHPISEFSSLRAQWDALNQRTANSPLLDSVFVSSTLEYFRNGHEVVAMCQGRDGLIAAGVFRRNKFGSWSTLQAAQSPLGAWVQDPDLAVDALLQGLGKALPGWSLLVALSQMDPDLVPRPAATSQLATLDYIRTARISVNQPFDDYWQLRGKNLRQNLRRQRNRLNREDVATRLEVINAAEQSDSAVDDYGLLETAGWKKETGTAIHPDNVQGRFYRALLRQYFEKGEARIYRYYYADKLVSTDLCLHRNGILYLLKTTYDETQKSTSPTMLMRYDIFKDMFENKRFKCVEFYGPVMAWHTKWTDEIRTMYHVNVYKQSLLKVIASRRQKT